MKKLFFNWCCAKSLQILFVILFVGALTSKAQVGKSFWFVVPEVTNGHGDDPIGLRITALDKKAVVTVNVPANGGFTPIVVTVNPYEQVTVRSDNFSQFSLNNVESRPHNTVGNKGIHITSNEDVTVYYEVLNQWNPDIFTLKGENALGKEFYVPSQNEFPNRPLTPQARERVDIVATEDNTKITISPTDKLLDRASTAPFTITLNKGQTYSIASDDWSTADESLGGTHIVADKDIAVTISDDSIEQWASSSAYDLIGDQLVPVSILGTEYIAIRTSPDKDAINKVYVMATADNTSVKVDNNADEVLNKGEIKQIDIANLSAYIKSSKPIYVYQVSGRSNGTNTNELGSALLPPITCTGSSRVTFKRNFDQQFWVQIMVKGKDRKNFTFYDKDNNNLTTRTTALNSASWERVSQTYLSGDDDNAWYTISLNMSASPYDLQTVNPYSIGNSTGLFHLGVLDQNGGSLSYGYYSSYSAVRIKGPSQACVGTKVILQSQYPGSVYWQSNLTGNTIISTASTLEVDQSGIYWLMLNNNQGCVATDSIHVNFTLPVFDLTPPGTLCPNQPAVFNLPTTYSYVWSTGATTPSVSIPAEPGVSKEISVTATNAQGCSVTKKVAIVAFPSELVDLTGAPATLCVGDTIFNSNTTMATYVWTINGTVVPNYSKPFIVASVTGLYHLKGISINGCISNTSRNFTVNALPNFNLTPATACAGLPVNFTGPNSMSSYTWSQVGVAGVTSTKNFQVTKPGLVTLKVVNGNGCKAQKTATPAWHAANPVSISYFSAASGTTITPDTVKTCPENPVNFTATSGFNSYVWRVNNVVNPATGAAINGIAVGANAQVPVRVTATDANSCVAHDTVIVKGYPTPSLVLPILEYCVGQTITLPNVRSRYEWLSLSNNAVVGTDRTFTPNTSGSYRITVWDDNNCVSTSVVITVNPLPVVTLAAPPQCAGIPVVFTPTTTIASTYVWKQDNALIDPLKNYTANSFATLLTDSVRVVATTAKGCIGKAAGKPLWHSNPSAQIHYINGDGEEENSDTALVCPIVAHTFFGTATEGTGGFAYEWKVNGVVQSNTNSIDVPATAQITLKITDVNGCIGRDTMQIFPLEGPSDMLNLVPNDICLGQTLSVGGFLGDLNGFGWSFDGGTYTTPDFTPSMAGVVTLSVQNKGGCNGSKNITVHNPAIVLPNSSLKVCHNTPHTFTVTPTVGFNYLWDNTVSGNSFTATQPGTYPVEAISTIVAGCGAKANVTLEWDESKIFDFDDVYAICAVGLPITISAKSSSGSFTWRKNGVDIGNSADYLEMTAVGDAGIYDVRWVTPNGCTVNQQFEFKIDDPQLQLDLSKQCNPVVTNQVCLCEDEQLVVLNQTGFTGWQWAKNDGTGFVDLPGETTAMLKITTTLGSGEYRVSASNGGCPASKTVTVSLTENPKFILNALDACENTARDIEISSISANGFNWFLDNAPKGVNVASTFSISANRSGDYVVKAQVAGSRCYTEKSITLNSPTIPTFRPLVDQKICENEPIDLNAKYAALNILTPITGYEWFGPTNVLLGDNNSISIIVAQKGTYTVHVEYDILNCLIKEDFVLDTVDLPDMNLVDATICNGSSAVIGMPVRKYTGHKWFYYGVVDPDISSGSLPLFPTPQPAMTATRQITVDDGGYYVLRARKTSGSLTCTNYDKVKLQVNPVPDLAITPDKDYLCGNGSVLLTASNNNTAVTSAITYSWASNDGPLGNGSLISVTKPGVYMLTGAAAGCKATKTTQVVNDVIVPVNLAGVGPICSGNSVTLNAPISSDPIQPVVSYKWYYNHVGNTLQGLDNTPWGGVGKKGRYVVEYKTKANGCADSAALDLIVYDLPLLPLTSTYAPVCDGNSVTLDVGGNYAFYKWTRQNSATSPEIVKGYSSVLNADTTGIYRVTAVTEFGCDSTNVTNITVNPNPLVSLGGSLFQTCPNVPLTLAVQNSSNLSGFRWSTGAIDNDKDSISVSDAGIYSVRAFDGNGCFADTTTEVRLHNPINFYLPQVAPICDNDSLTLFSPVEVPRDVQNYQWFFNNVGNTQQGGLDSSWTVNTAGNYVLRVLDNSGCVVTQTTGITTIPSPKFNLGPDRDGCYFDSLRIETRQSYARYEWNGNPADNKYYKMVDPAITNYTLRVDDINGCSTTSTVNFRAHPLPVVSLGQDLAMCAGPLTTLNVGNSYDKVLWSTGANTPSLVVDAGRFWVKVTDGFGCSARDTINITWWPNPRPNLGPDELVCPVDTVILDAGGGFTRYAWHTGANTQTEVANNVDTVNLVTVTDDLGCLGWDSKLVFRLINPDYGIDSDTMACKNEIVVLDGGAYDDFWWSTGERTQTIDVTTPGTYAVRVSDGCFLLDDTVNVSFWDLPVVAKLDTMLYAQITILADGGTKPYQYALNDGSYQSDNVFKPVENGTYIAYVEDVNGCLAIDTVAINSVLDLKIPKFFTPNGDGANDEWLIGGLKERLPDAEIIIYDRYGKQLAKFSGEESRWDGRYLGKPMPSDDYWYVINLVRVQKTIKGNLTLIR